MRILHVTKKYPNALGGDATGSFNLEKMQKRKGNELFVLTTNSSDIISKDNITKFGLKGTTSDWDFINFKRLMSLSSLLFRSFSIIRKLKPDVIHSHSADLGLILSPAAKIKGIPIINQCRGVSFPYPENPLPNRFFEKFCLKNGRFNKIVTVDENSLPFFEEEKIPRTIYMPNGIDLSEFNRKKKSRSGKKIKFIFVGRLEEQKGLIYLIDAVNMLKSKKLNFEINIVGDGSLKESLIKKMNDFGLEKYFNFLGPMKKSEVVNEYFSSDIFILPSIWEGFPNTLLEAWGARLPVIITDVGGVSKICTNNENAIIVPKRDSKSLARKMELLMKDNKLREKLGKNSNILVREKYSWEGVSNRFLELYSGEVKNEIGKR